MFQVDRRRICIKKILNISLNLKKIYQAFIKKANNEFITEFEEPNLNHEEIKSIFLKMMDDVQCEKFIAVGHLLENMFSQNVKQSYTTMNILIYLYQNLFIDQEDIKHG